jgi:hypothetical protein
VVIPNRKSAIYASGEYNASSIDFFGNKKFSRRDAKPAKKKSEFFGAAELPASSARNFYFRPEHPAIYE